MSIVIFGDLFSFPDGLAATNRVYTYAKGFRENGIAVHVICFSNIYMDNPDGETEGIKYYNPFGRRTRSRYFLVRRWQKLVKYRRTYSIIRKINKADKVMAINRWSDTFTTQLFAWLLARRFGTKIITECNEHPFRFHTGGALNRWLGRVRFFWDTRLSDGILCISKYLVNLHLEKGIPAKKLFHIPSTVDPSRFAVNGEKPFPYPYAGYFGSLTFYRDNVDLLIRAFARFSPQHPEVRLVLGGFCREDERKNMMGLIDQLAVRDKVQVIDYLTRQEITRYITHADVLVMTRARDMESDASYPSKLSEFLATGKPVISVNVGEIADFLTDQENAYLVEPGNVEGMTEKLQFVFDNYDTASRAGLKGRELTSGVFNYSYQVGRMISFIQSLYNKKEDMALRGQASRVG